MIAASASAATRPAIICGYTPKAAVRPSACDVWRGFEYNSRAFAHIHWASWGSKQATSKGIETGEHYPLLHIPAGLTAYHPARGCNGALYFVRLRVTEAHGAPWILGLPLPRCKK